jgi:hypothetical protein
VGGGVNVVVSAAISMGATAFRMQVVNEMMVNEMMVNEMMVVV